MNPVEALGLFIGIPLALAAVIAVAVGASSWTRSGRVTGDYDSGPFMVLSSAPLPDPSIVVDESSINPVAGGGVSARW
ncbi:MAG: hypothetical protein U0R65_07695 [Candidatus Nanopelagicales bacterium]